jgi:NAD(P)-dependent dehydrogenase (short-subunit alcohol dehydrogenase family)
VFGRTPVVASSVAGVDGRVAVYAVDVTDAALKPALDAAVAAAGRFDGVVLMQRNRAADDFEADLAVALTASKNIIEHLLERGHFNQAPQGNSVVMVSSIADHYVAPEQDAGYHVSKAGLVQLARYYALRLGPFGIRVNVVSPCVVIKEEAREFYRNNSWLTERFERFIPLGRAGSSQDIVNAIMFLLGAQSSYITGQNIVVDGGLTLRSHESIIGDFQLGE